MNRIVCIGCVTLDRSYVVPCVVSLGNALLCQEYHESWGGKGLNQLIASQRAGAQSVFYSKVGQKDYVSLVSFLSEYGICADSIRSVDGFTNHGVIQVDPQGRTAIIGVANPEMNYSQEELNGIIQNLQKSDVLILQNEIDQIPYVIKKIKEKGCTIVLNPSPLSANVSSWPFADIDYLILNKQEGQYITGCYETGEIIDFLSTKYPDLHILLTLGDSGSIYRFKDECFFQPPYNVKTIDTICAGDSFTGFFMASLIAGRKVKDALDIAAKAAAIVVSRRGAADTIPTLEEIENYSFMNNEDERGNGGANTWCLG